MNDNVELARITSIPGFTVLEHTPGFTVLTVPSGFTLKVTRVGPYAFDSIDESLRDPGPFTITVTLLEKLQPPGVQQTIIYKPPRNDNGDITEPDREQHERAWMYYHQWQEYELKRRELAIAREAVRIDIALLNSVSIVSGPVDVSDDEWLQKVIPAVTAPSDYGSRLLLFLKLQVISTIRTADILRGLMLVGEVTVKGLKQAFDGF